MKNLKSILFTFVFVFTSTFSPLLSTPAWAHAEHSEDEPDIEHYERILERLGNLNIVPEDSGAQSLRASTTIPSAPMVALQAIPNLAIDLVTVPAAFLFPSFDPSDMHLNFGGTKVVIDNAWWELSDELSRLYIAEIKKACADCVMPSVEDIQKEAKNLVTKGWFSTKAVGLKDAVMYRYVGEFIGLGAKYGPAAGILKVAGELMEDALLVIFKMPGAHFLCEAITLAIATYSGAFLTAARGLHMPGHFDRFGITTLVRTAVTSYYVKRSLKRLTIEVPEFEIDDHELEDFVEGHKDKNWTYRLTGRHRVDKFLRGLEGKINKQRARIEALQANREGLSASEQKRLLAYEEEGLRTSLTIKTKVFNNHRKKRALLLRKHRSQGGFNEMATNTSSLFGKTKFWFFELKNEIFEPNVQRLAEKQFTGTGGALPVALNAEPDAVTAYQLDQYGLEGASREWAFKVFASIDQINDAKQSSTIRYFNFTFFESFFSQVMPRLAGEMIEHGIADLPKKERRFKDVGHLQWKVGKVTYFTNYFVDFMRFSTFDKRNSDPTMKYHMRDYASLIMKTHSELTALAHLDTSEEVISASKAMDDRLDRLDEGRFWREKTKEPHLFPAIFGGIFRGGMTCEKLYM